MPDPYHTDGMARILAFLPNWFSSPVSKGHHHLPFIQETYKWFFFFYSCCFLFPHISHPIHYKSYRLNLEKYILIFLEYLFYLLKPSWAKPLATVKSCLSYFGSEVISERLSSLKSKFGSQLLSS